MPHGITQCYLPPGRGDIPALTPAEAGTRLSDPGGMQCWVDQWSAPLHTRYKHYTHRFNPQKNRGTDETSYYLYWYSKAMRRRLNAPQDHSCDIRLWSFASKCLRPVFVRRIHTTRSNYACGKNWADHFRDSLSSNCSILILIIFIHQINENRQQ